LPKKSKHKNFHHLNPSSRAPELLKNIENPPQSLIKKIYKKKLVNTEKHDAWHKLFSNMFAWEAVEQVKLWANKNLSGLKIALNFNQWHAWQRIFGANATPKEAIEIIKRDWWPEYPPPDKDDFFIYI
jgi:ribosome biogenesis GTPase A